MINKIEPMDLNCNIFSVYDYDDYSIQELLSTFFTKINDCVDLSNKTFKLAEWLVNQGLRQEVAKTMERWWNEGKFGEIFTQDVLSGIDKRITANTEKSTENATAIEKLKQKMMLSADEITPIKPTMTNDEINEKIKNGGTFLWKKGEYILEEDREHIEHDKTCPKSFFIKSNSTHIFEDGAIIKPWIDDRSFYTLLHLEDVKNVTLIHPQIDGLRREGHDYGEGQWGYGIAVYSATNVDIENADIRNTTGDGIYVGYKWTMTGHEVNKTNNIKVNNPYIYNCIRNGISICGGKDIFVNDPYIAKIDGHNPKACIDIEPENSNMCLVELENVNINGGTYDNPNVLQIVKTKGFTKDCNINVNNLNILNCDIPFAWYTSTEHSDRTVNATFNNIRIDKFKSQLFHITDKPLDDILTIKKYSKLKNTFRVLIYSHFIRLFRKSKRTLRWLKKS